MNHHLTTIASLPTGAGFAASLPAEKNEQRASYGPEIDAQLARYEVLISNSDPLPPEVIKHVRGLIKSGQFLRSARPRVFQIGKVTATNVDAETKAWKRFAGEKYMRLLGLSPATVQMKAPYFEGPEELPGDMDEEGGE